MKQIISCACLFFLGLTGKSQTDFCYWIEPDATYINAEFDGADDYSELIQLPFSFDFFGEIYNEVVLTAKGTIVLGNEGYTDFLPSAFPDPLTGETSQQYNHICGFWSDFDFSGSGDLYYKVTDEALYVNYINVGYWPHQSDLTNSFQMIISASGSEIIGNGNNVQFYYKDMQWANSMRNGASDGFDAEANLAIVGADKQSGPDHFTFGRFNLENENYNGPYGITQTTQDGLFWLNKKVIAFNTATNGANTPPGMVMNVCPDFGLCSGQYQFELFFTSSENTQAVNADIAGFPAGLNYIVTTYPSAVRMTGNLYIEDAAPGAYNMVVTATDAGNPSESATADLSLNVAPNDIELAISGDTMFCRGTSVELTATAGMDYYFWNNGDQDATATYDDAGPAKLIALKDGCYLETFHNLLLDTVFFPQLNGGNFPIIICSGQDTVVCVQEEFASYSWQVEPGYEGAFIEGEPLNQQCAHVVGGDGHYRVTVEDEEGCTGFNLKIVEATDLILPLSNPDPQCDLSQPVQMEGGVQLLEDNLLVYAISTNNFGWQGSYLNIYVIHADGSADTSFFTSFDNLANFDDMVITSGDSIAIEYVPNGNDFQGNSLWIINCYESTPITIPAPLTAGIVWSGMASCPGEPLPGQWSVEGPEGWTISNDQFFDMEFGAAVASEYAVCFLPDVCLSPYCYSISFPDSVDVEINQPDSIPFCGLESLMIQAIADPDYEVTWTGEGITVSEDQINAQVGPYPGYGTTVITVSQSNYCYSDSDSLVINYYEDVSSATFGNVTICGEPVVADPFPGTQNDEYIDCIWTNILSGQFTISPTYTFTEPGDFSAQFLNDCSASDVLGFIALSDSMPQVLSSVYGGTVFCDNDGVEIFSTDQTNGSYMWSIEPADAGTIVTIQEDSIYVDFNDGYAGYAVINVEAMNICGSSGTVELETLIDDCSLVAESVESSIHLYPNPAREYLIIDSPYTIESVELFNLVGQRFSSTKDQMIHLETLPAGMYVIRLKTTAGVFHQQLEILR